MFSVFHSNDVQLRSQGLLFKGFLFRSWNF